MILIAVILLCPIVLVLGPPIGCIAFTVAVLQRPTREYGVCCQCFMYILVSPIAFCFGLALDVVIVPVAIVIGIPSFIFFQFYSKYKMWKKSKERLKDRL